MTRIRLVSIVCAVVAAIGIAMLIAAPLAYRAGFMVLGTSFNVLGLSVILEFLVLCCAIGILYVCVKRKIGDGKWLSGVALACAVVHLSVVGAQITPAFLVPPIHDITTDGEDIPAFTRAIDLRSASDNSLVYGSAALPPADHWAMQVKAYPHIGTLRTHRGMAEAVDQALSLITEQGLEVTDTDLDTGRIEAVATTFWFGFKDDLVIRIRAAAGGGAVIDLRSNSRVGGSDIGANAARIDRFIQAFRESDGRSRETKGPSD